MACIVETLGLTLPGCATLPALDPAREELCRATGRRIVDLVREERRQGRRVLVYITHTASRDISARLESILAEAGYSVATLKSDTTSADRREEQ
jgi:hypothetical protein